MSSNKRKYWWLWAIWIGIFLAIETFAIITKEATVPTLSRTLWWLKGKWKLVFGIIWTVFMIWLYIHIQGGECALGLC